MIKNIKIDDWQPSGGIQLDDTARHIVTSETSMSVIAGPGSGKTELLAQRAFYLLQTGICRSPQRILAISFKRDAAKNLKDRVATRCTPEQSKRFDSYTFDAFAKTLVDRFLALAPGWCRPGRNYRIWLPSAADLDSFRGALQPPASLGGYDSLQQLDTKKFERWGPLPLVLNKPSNITEWAAANWWSYCLLPRRNSVTFGMLARLAESILRHNSAVQKALRLTYSHVFLDEFQDTTRLQYDLTKCAFNGSDAVLTAVGDTMQRIMTWAGAEADVFSWYESEFGARRIKLSMNYRSNKRIVQIINDLTKVIEPTAIETVCARSDDIVPDEASIFWQYPTNAVEASALAKFIFDDIENNRHKGRMPDEFAILVRVKADEVEKRLRDAFNQYGLRIRNEARLIGGIAIQDLMTDEIVLLLTGFIRLAIGVRSHEVYQSVVAAVGSILQTDYENSRDSNRLDNTIKDIISTIRKYTADAPDKADTKSMIASIVSILDIKMIRRAYRKYDDEKYLSDIQKSLVSLLSEYISVGIGWSRLLDDFEGKEQVHLMTIHKSKGLEYHTVIFVGLHENAFWGYRNNKSEETNNFFVALSRARERVYFTRSDEAGDTTQIAGLVKLLDKAKVPVKNVTSQN